LNQTSSSWQKLWRFLSTGKIRFKTPVIDVVEYEIGKTNQYSRLDLHDLAVKLSEQLRTQPFQEIYRRFDNTNKSKKLIIQVEGKLYCPLSAASYIKQICEFFLSLPDLPNHLSHELEYKVRLPEIARQYDFSSEIDKLGHSTIFKDQLEWAKKKYPGIEEDFKRYIRKHKTGLTKEVNGKLYNIALMGHPEAPEVFIYFPEEARNFLPPPTCHVQAKVIGIISYDPDPPFSKMRKIYLRAVCFFGRLHKRNS